MPDTGSPTRPVRTHVTPSEAGGRVEESPGSAGDSPQSLRIPPVSTDPSIRSSCSGFRSLKMTRGCCGEGAAPCAQHSAPWSLVLDPCSGKGGGILTAEGHPNTLTRRRKGCFQSAVIPVAIGGGRHESGKGPSSRSVRGRHSDPSCRPISERPEIVGVTDDRMELDGGRDPRQCA